MKRAISFFLAFVLIISLVPHISVGAHAVSEQEYLDSAALALQMRQHMKDRDENFNLYLKTDDPAGINNTFMEIYEEAMGHTGDPAEGDYLRYHHGNWSVGEMPYYQDSDFYYVTIPVHMEYYSNAQQEWEVSFVSDLLLSPFKNEEYSDYQKIREIYSLITQNVEYDYDHLSDPNYTRKYTAYAALVEKSAVCQGYANLFYRMALSLGLDCRIVTGKSQGEDHAWNIVKLDGKYYYVDATWDAPNVQAGGAPIFFLLGSNNFTDHIPDSEMSAFLADYPISTEDYILEGPGGTVPPAEEDLYHEYEWDVLAIVNRERHLNGLDPVTTVDKLFEAAGVRAVELMTLMDHTRPNGTKCFTAIDETGYSYSRAGENIAGGQVSPQTVMTAWMNSPGHRKNILTPEFFHMGVGYCFDRNAQYRHNWVQMFASTWDCTYTSCNINATTVRVEAGTAIEDMQLWAELICAGCGTCYLPIIPEYCTGYDPNKSGAQTVTVSVLGFTKEITVTTEAGGECTDHQWSNWEVTKSATCEDEGEQYRTCTVCGEKETEKISALGHIYEEQNTHYLATPSDCGHAATYYYSCSNPGCDKMGTETFTYGEKDPTKHVGNTELRGVVEATLDHEGYTGDTCCTTCDAVIQKGQTIPQKTHKFDEMTLDYPATPADCGHAATYYYSCSNPGCNEKGTETFTYGEKDPTKHVGDTELRGVVEATEESEGYTGDTYCTTCEAKIKEGTVIPKKAHVHQLTGVSAKAPTCKEQGNIAYWTCGGCEKWFADGKGNTEIADKKAVYLAPAAHSYDETGKCTDCGDPKVRPGDSNGDGKVDNIDAMRILQCFVGLLDKSQVNLDACDVNGDGKVDNIDAMWTLQIFVGLRKL